MIFRCWFIVDEMAVMDTSYTAISVRIPQLFIKLILYIRLQIQRWLVCFLYWYLGFC